MNESYSHKLTQPGFRRTRGVATIEALLVLTTLIIVWAGVSYMGKLIGAQLASKSQARSCAWQISLSGCKSVPEECQMSEEADDEHEDVAPEKTDGLSQARDENETDDKEMDGIRETLDTEMSGLFKKRVSASASREVPESPILKLDKSTLNSSFSLPCNTRPKDVLEMARDLLDEF